MAKRIRQLPQMWRTTGSCSSTGAPTSSNRCGRTRKAAAITTFRPKAGKTASHQLTAATVRRHLEGDLTLGVYAMNPATQRCKWIAMDGDYKESLKHLCELQWELQQQKVEAALEQSRRGAHLWIFGEQPLLARQCRLLISGLAQKLGIPVKGAGTAEGIEIFPKHDELKDGDFGNAIRGPLGIHRAISARFWFYGADYNLDNQLAFLKRVTKLSEEQLGALLQKLGQPSEGEKKEIKPAPRWQYPAQQRQFHILDHSRCGGRREELDHAMPFVRRGGTRQERRQPGDLG
jgi:hypothetical protein